MLTAFTNFIKIRNLFQKHDSILLTVSGGVDSVVMCELFYKEGFKFGIAHCNFKLRGKESDEDEHFVKTLAEKYKVPFFTKTFNTKKYADENKLSIQMAARELRYNWFEEVRKENHFNYIATAHHKDDNIETVLFHLVKGTGIRGLQGILPKQGKIIRPLLFTDKKNILHFAGKHSLLYREDSSNNETKYERNWIRHNLIPKFEELNQSFRESFSDSIEHFADAVLIYNKALEGIVKKMIRRDGEAIYISIPKLINHPAHNTVLYEMLLPYGFNAEQVKQINEQLMANPGAMFFSATHRLLKDRKELILTPINAEFVQEEFVNPETKKIKIGDASLKIDIIPADKFRLKKDKAFTALDNDKLEFPLVVRKWKQGDYFYPFGMKKKKKKVSDFLIDAKVPISEKEKTFVLLSGEKICAVIGRRPDERFIITGKTKAILQLQLAGS